MEYKGRLIKYLKPEDLADDLFEILFEKHEGFLAGDIVFGRELGDAAYCLRVGVVKPSKAKDRRVASLVPEKEIEDRISNAIAEIEMSKNAQIEDLQNAGKDLAVKISEVIGLEEVPEDLVAEVKDFVESAGEAEEVLKKEIKDLTAALEDAQKKITALEKKAKAPEVPPA